MPFAALDVRMIAHSGIGTHVRGILQGIAALGRQREVLLIGPPELLAQHVEASTFDQLAFDAPIYSLSEQVSFPWPVLRKMGLRVVHFPHYNVPLTGGSGFKLAITIHDVIHLTHAPGLALHKRLYAHAVLRGAARRAHRLLTVSHHSAGELARVLGAAADRIGVTYNAPASAFLNRPPDADIARVIDSHLPGLSAGRYLVTAGIAKPHKNLEFLVRSMAALWRSGQTEIALVMIGPQAPDTKLLHRMARSVLGECDADLGHLLRFPGRVGSELPYLYAGAMALVQPSLAEGFGLPVVEAQSVGTPVLVSLASSIPEVAGAEGGLYFDPRLEASLQSAVLRLEGGPDLRASLRAAGQANAARFSWRETANQLLDIYKELAA